LRSFLALAAVLAALWFSYSSQPVSMENVRSGTILKVASRKLL